MEKNEWIKKRVLIVVKTYPNKSQKYEETVCIAGITEEGEWIRLYPVNFRDLDQRFSKYQWISLYVKKRKDDIRTESYTPNLDSIVLEDIIDTKGNWAKRKEIILPPVTRPTTVTSIDTVKNMYGVEGNCKSLFMFKPKEVTDLTFKSIPRSKWQEHTEQMSLFAKEPQMRRKLEPIDTSFYYEFTCEDPNCTGHRYSIIDWEAGQLWRNLKQEYDDDVARDKFKEKWLGMMCDPNKDTYFFLGNKYMTRSFMVLGVFYPPKVKMPTSEQISLF